MEQRSRSRRSVLVVPGGEPALLEQAKGSGSDAVLLDLEDTVAPADKATARGHVVDALTSGSWGTRLRTVRVNDLGTRWTYRDVIEVVEGAGAHLDALVLPRVRGPEHVVWLDLLLAQVEATMGLPVGGIGIEAEVGTALGLQHVGAIAAASQRLRALVLCRRGVTADLGLLSGAAGSGPLDPLLLAVRTAATAAGLQAVDGSVLDGDAFRAQAIRSATLGLDGTWVGNASQVDVAHEVFTRGA